MGKAKNNQAKNYFSYKNDEIELVDLCQFLRETTEYRVEREWYVLFDQSTGAFLRVVPNVPNNIPRTIKPRNPDIILINKKTNKLVLVVEIDGEVHRVKFLDTEERNQDYFLAGLPLLVIEKANIDTNIFDYVHRTIGEKLGSN